MSETDLTNLHFILFSPPEVIVEWWEMISERDRCYAMSLLLTHQWNLIDQAVEYSSLDEANSVIKRIERM